MTRLVYNYWGAGIALGVYGTRSEVERTCTGLYNINATDSDPIWLNEDPKTAFAYVLTSFDRLRKGLADKFIVGFLTNKKTKHLRFKGGFMPMALKKAEERISTILPEQFLGNHADAPQPFRLALNKIYNQS